MARIYQLVYRLKSRLNTIASGIIVGAVVSILKTVHVRIQAVGNIGIRVTGIDSQTSDYLLLENDDGTVVVFQIDSEGNVHKDGALAINSDDQIVLRINGNNKIAVVDPSTNDAVSFQITRESAPNTLIQVMQGEVDSGGVGFRALVIDN
jgi:hypothetical protein